MKNIVYIVLGIVAIVFVSIVIKNALEPDVVVSEKEDVITYFENDESFIFVLGNSRCLTCKQYKNGTLVEYLKTSPDMPLVFAYTDESFEDSNDLATFLTTYGIRYSTSPTTYLVIDGQVVDSITEDISIKKLQSFIDNRS